MRIIVTGASGNLGQAVVARLTTDGHEVVAASRRPVPSPGGSLALDLRRDDSVEALARTLGPGSTLVHLACSPPAGDDWLAVDVLGTMRAYEAAARARAAAVVYASCRTVYGGRGDEPPPADHRTRPTTAHAAARLAGEDHLYALRGEEPVRAVALRLPRLDGPAGGAGVRAAAEAIVAAVLSGESGLFDVLDGALSRLEDWG